MAEFESVYPELTFFVGDEPRYFSRGRYVTKNKDEIQALSSLAHVSRVDGDMEEEAPTVRTKRKSSTK
ncbi:hypothetical protein [Thermoactinomyces sp. DSM 45892]|uniref:hypothetical protein n=1 Tax=Thermoactinomyces sp. DSM 45892 TaxID=1882753 RepID=UPI00089C5FBE|nr:hypothetical protein [Thermoactinomyces sp. DSM 45892]SDZ05104.1 hypothetical protein SAMN05444416_11280 [Thermoactinomyces sp. DSM 45892]